MKTVYKYNVPLGTDRPFVDMPEGAQILHVGAQGDDLCLWALVEPDAEQTRRHFHLVGTGRTVPDVKYDLDHIGTALLMGGRLVLHLFEEVCREINS